MQVSAQREMGRLLDVPAVIAWFQSSPVPRWILLGVVLLGVVTTISRRSAPGNASASGGLGLLIWLGLLLGGAYWLWRSVG